jgi:hypothetical protein
MKEKSTMKEKITNKITGWAKYVDRNLMHVGFCASSILSLTVAYSSAMFLAYATLRVVYVPWGLADMGLQASLAVALVASIVDIFATTWGYLSIKRKKGSSAFLCAMMVLMVCGVYMCSAWVAFALPGLSYTQMFHSVSRKLQVNLYSTKPDEQAIFSRMEKNLKCCGIEGPGDYITILYIHPPASCCVNDCNPLMNPVPELYNKGCGHVVAGALWDIQVCYMFLMLFGSLIQLLWVAVMMRTLDPLKWSISSFSEDYTVPVETKDVADDQAMAENDAKQDKKDKAKKSA